MRSLTALPAALAAALGLVAAAAPGEADARSPVIIDGADKEAREAILDLLPDRDAPTTLFEAERIAEEAASRAMAWLRSEGYYAAEVAPEAEENPPAARLRIAPGVRFRFADPQLTFDEDEPDAAAAEAANNAVRRVTAGAPARAADVLGAEADALAALLSAGYADAHAAPRRVIVDHLGSTVTAQFHLVAGAKTRLGAVRAEPPDVFRQSFLDHLRGWKPGDHYSPDKLAALRRNLASTGAVSRVSTRLEPADENGVRNVVIELEPAKRNAYELGGGWSTTEGAGVEAEWTRRNFSGRADALTLSTTLGEKVQSAGIELSRPHAAGIGHTQRVGATVVHEVTDAFTRQGVNISAGVDAAPRLRLARSYGVELSADHFDNTAGGVEQAYVLSGYGDLRRDTTGHPLDARDGSILEGRIEPSVSAGEATISFVRATAEARFYRSFGKDEHFTIATRAHTGWLAPISGDQNDIPPDRRFYAGGGGSVRGYAYNSIYPLERDALGLAPGGQGALEASAELRYRFGERLGAVAFVDGGNAFDDWNRATNLKWGAGVGARYDLGFAPLRVDIAFPLDDTPGGESFALYISLGQAF
jgi:translocation and assembly module TamA